MNKVYACSDIHANLKQLNNLLEFMDDNDKLYIIGDVVDKGPDKLDVLKKIMKDNRITLLLGNHDLMMLAVIDNIDNEYINNTYYYESVYNNWIKYNHGHKTLNAFLRMEENERKELINYLKNCPILLNIEVDNKKYVLVHAYPENMGEKDIYLDELKIDNTDIYDWTSDYLWHREAYLHLEDKILLTGHTPVAYYGSLDIVHDDKWYDLDCGLANLQEEGKLGVLCLNDLKEYYF